MSIELKVPVFPESVTDGTLTTWHKKPGDTVTRGENIVDIETDKVIFEVPSLEDGVIENILVDEGDIVLSGQVIAHITKQAGMKKQTQSDVLSESVKEDVDSKENTIITPSAQKMINENNLDAKQITASGKDGRVLKEDVISYLKNKTLTPQEKTEPASPIPLQGERIEKRVPMTRLRKRIAERLLQSQQTAAILTTINEVNMQPVMELRKRYQDKFEKKHGVRLGFMSFFVTAVVEALKRFPEVNASIDGDDIVYHGFFDIGIAVGSPRGLVVPILRDAEQLSVAQIEQQINDYGQRAKEGSLTLEEITGGTFSITNGGVFGSLLSTPILNPPQSGILGMHKIQPRPMVVDNEIVILPMMYLAFSYDHRIIDGKEAVQFLVAIKELLEDPARLILQV
ncbi:MAG: 2-oxoglutarate dehydrogenase complex dihydrolipoyllysine-residue succinyltransferase [Gammaproteobacteria bacterium]|nr:MAG: 2-oxoglutarate dehydrogenase complex dihydrolipoyllysine-residue succinyltransferase [Gammaproteobacteria bacterium]